MAEITFDYVGSTNLTITRGDKFDLPVINATNAEGKKVKTELLIMHNYMVMFDVDTDITGTYVLVYTATDRKTGASKDLSIYVDVVSQARGPVFNWNDTTMHIERCQPLEVPDVVALDEDGLVPVSRTIEFNGNVVTEVKTHMVGTYLLTYKATGKNGHTSALRKTIHIGPNTTPPQFDYDGPTTFVVSQNEKFCLPEIHAIDDVDDADELEVTVTITRNGERVFEVDTAIAGVYVIYYRVMDLDGNENELVMTVIVKQDFSHGLFSVMLDGYSDCEIVEIFRCEEFKMPKVIIEEGMFAEWDIVLNGKPVKHVDTSIAGEYVLTCTVMDYAGMASATSLIVIVKGDIEPPVLHYDGALSFIVGRGEDFTMPHVTATDNLDGVVINTTITYNGARVDQIDTTLVGLYLITFLATDADGNDSEPIEIKVDVS